MKGTKIIAMLIAGCMTMGVLPISKIVIPTTNIVANSADELIYGDYKYEVYSDSNGEYVEIYRYIGSDSTVVIPSKIKGLPVKSIGVGAFGGNRNVVGEMGYAKEFITKVTIPEGITTIKKWGFCGCTGIESINLPNSLETIGEEAFFNCSSLTTVTIPKNVKRIDYGTFIGCSGLKKAILSEGVTEISGDMFYKCTSLNSISIPNTVTSIGDKAFYGCNNLEEIYIPDSVESLGSSAFSDCSSLSKITLSDNIPLIKERTFYECRNLKEISLPFYTSSIGTSAFYNVPLEKLYIGAKLKSTNNLPIDSVLLKTIDVSEDNMYYSSESGVLFDKEKKTLIRFPAAMVQSEYKVPNSVEIIGESAFKDNNSIRYLYLYQNCSNVEPTAFQNCSKLDKIYFYNINCDIYMARDTLFEDTVINGYKNSSAQAYATMYNRPFNAIPTDESVFIGTWYLYKYKNQGNEYTYEDIEYFTFNKDHSGVYVITNKETPITWQANGNTIIWDNLIIEFNGTDLFVKVNDDEYGEIIMFFRKGSSLVTTTTTTTTATTTTTTTTTSSVIPTTTTTTTKRFELNVQNITLYVGEQFTIKSNQAEVTYRSSNSDIATVGKTSGIITALCEGNATIFATNVDGDTLMIKATVVNNTNTYGDANLDGKVTVADAVAILQYIANKDKYMLTEIGKKNADCYNVGDGITGSDALAIQKLDAKVITSLPTKSIN